MSLNGYKFASRGILTALLTLGIGSIALADAPGNHPRYIHARSDLQKASILLHIREEDSRFRDQGGADNEVRAAIREIDHAAFLDQKNLDDHPNVDVSLRGTNRLHEISRLLQSAKGDIRQEEDNPDARAWRNRAESHIDRAMNWIAQVLNNRDNNYDSNHNYPRDAYPRNYYPRY